MKGDVLETVPMVPEPVNTTGVMEMFERLARDPNASVDKIERLMALIERGQAKQAEEHFNASMSRAQKAMRPVAADATNPQTRSRYASYEALDRALRPIYTDNGFAPSFNTGDASQPDYVRVICDVAHIGGHSRQYHLDMPADGKGAKGGDVMTKTHAVGSALSYGMRYLLKMIFNVAVGEDDDDGNAAGKAKPAAPAGYDKFLEGLEDATVEGLAALEAAFKAGKVEHRNYLTNHDATTKARLKTKAGGK